MATSSRCQTTLKGLLFDALNDLRKEGLAELELVVSVEVLPAHEDVDDRLLNPTFNADVLEINAIPFALGTRSW